MQDRMARRPRIGVAGVLALAVGAALAGASLSACSSMSDNPFTPFADPGTYAYHNCEQIAGLQASFRTKEQELRMLMDKAEQSTGGAIVNVIAYQAEYAKARDELKVLEATARRKNCKPQQ
jgi:Spy/CpxP family protein refolding chaperone